jgi:hypothetical protein
MDLTNTVSSLGLDKQEWEVLAGRYGVPQHLTLREIGRKYGVTPERIRQIDNRAYSKLKYSASAVLPALAEIEKNAQSIAKPSDLTDLDEIADGVCQHLTLFGHTGVDQANAVRLIVAIRTLVKENDTRLIEAARQFSRFACELFEPITKHPDIGIAEAHRQLTYFQIAEKILKLAEEPLTPEEIVERAVAAGLREDLLIETMRSTLSQSDQFVHVGAGKYALREWNLEPLETLAAIIEKILRQHEIPLSLSKIKECVNSYRPFKDATLKKELAEKSQFYNSKDDLYGLREWLPRTDSVEDSTPTVSDSYIETPASQARLTRRTRHPRRRR